MKKKQQNLYLILGITAIIIFIYGGQSGWFKSSLSVTAPAQTYVPIETSAPTLSSCSALCSQESYPNSASSFTTDGSDCAEGAFFFKYGYPNQEPLLKCCCWKTPTSTDTCVDSDGENKDLVGNVLANGERYYDKCLSVGQAVTEYICENNQVKSKNLACDYGETCMQTRSGGHCITSSSSWNPGDTVFQGSGSGVLTGSSSQIGSFDLGDYGIEANGNCRLGAQIQTSWSYANPNDCAGIQGAIGVKWEFFDSSGLEYTRLDATPTGLGVDLHPESHILQWDGVTNWRGEMSKVPNIMPQCIINYEYSMRIYIYDCA